MCLQTKVLRAVDSETAPAILPSAVVAKDLGGGHAVVAGVTARSSPVYHGILDTILEYGQRVTSVTDDAARNVVVR